MIESAKEKISLLLSPLALPEFMSRYWEQEPLHIERNDPGYFGDLLSLQQIESLLSNQSLYFPSVQLSRKQSPVVAEAYTDGDKRIVPSRLIEEHRQGATIVMSGAHQWIPTLAAFRRGVQAELGLRCQTNLYLSPSAVQGFGAHYDSHDVFILQVQGSKTFNFYEGGVELPYSHEGFDAQRHEPGVLAERITVHAGDTLYIPRGVFHDAVACEESSLHITLGLYAVTLREALLEMVDVMTEKEPRFRRSVPPAHWEGNAASASSAWGTEQITESLKDLLAGPMDERLWQTARTRLLNAIALDNAQDCSTLLTFSREELLPHTLIRVKPGALMAVERFGQTIICRFPGQVLELPDPLAQAFEALLKVSQQRLSDWRDLDENQQLALCEQLLQANIIDVVDETALGDNEFDGMPRLQ